MQQLVSPNLGQTSRAGMCLYFSRSSFGAPNVEESAWEAWENTKYKHTDALPNACVPVWFQHYGSYGTPPVYKNWGHVADYIPGRGVLSSPITFVGPGQEWFPSVDALVNAINRIMPGSKTAYVGWSEDISNVRVVKDDDMITSNDTAPVRVVMSECEGWDFNQIHSGSVDGQIMGAWVGHSWPEFIMHTWTVQPTKRQNLVDKVNELSGLIANLNKRPTQEQLDALSASVADLQGKLAIADKAVADSKAAIPEVTLSQIQETNTIVKSIKGMLVNFIGWVKAKLGK